GVGVFRVQDRRALGERIDEMYQCPEIVERRCVVLDARASRREDDRQHLADREEVDVVAVDEAIEQLVHHPREELPLVEAEHIGAELRVLDTPSRAMHRAVRDAHDTRADVPLLVRALVERPREVGIEERGADVLVAVEGDRRGELGEQSASAHVFAFSTVIARVGQLKAASASTSASAVSAPGSGTETPRDSSRRNACGASRAQSPVPMQRSGSTLTLGTLTTTSA